MTSPRPTNVSGSFALNVDKLVQAIVDGVLAGLDAGDRSGYRYNADIDHHAPPRYGEHYGKDQRAR